MGRCLERTVMTREEVKELLMNIKTYYPNFKIDDPKRFVNAWYMMLQDEDCFQVAMALKEYIKTDMSGFAPSIGNILSRVQVDENKFEDEALSWSKVYKAICNSGYESVKEFDKLDEDVKRAVGSPSQLKQWAISSDFNQGVESALFYRRLAAVRDSIKVEKIMKKGENQEKISGNVQKLIE